MDYVGYCRKHLNKIIKKEGFEMEFNWMGELTKQKVIALLRKRGCDIKAVNALNMIMEEMGLIIRLEGQCSTTEEGIKYTSCNSQVVDAAVWRPSGVDAIYKFLKE